MQNDYLKNNTPTDANNVLAADINPLNIRANTPTDYDCKKHRVTKFKRDNYIGYYTPNTDGYYTYKGELKAESSIHYTEGALLAGSDFTVVEYVCR
mgnify:FL=1|jgi:hypothetical protein